MIYTRNSFVNFNYKLEDADVCFIGIPFDSTSIESGSRNGPVAVREALKNIEGYDTETGIDIFEKLKICDIGDIEVVPGSYKLTAERIKETISEILERNPEIFIISVGGEHSITLPIVEIIKPDTILDFDAHADMRREYLGVEYSHATWAYHAMKRFNLVQRGVRSFSREEYEIIKKLGDEIRGRTYLTIDIDVFDPSIAPETALPEPDGWNLEEFCKNLNDVKNLISMDIVEIAPKSFNSITANLAANIIKRILCKLVI